MLLCKNGCDRPVCNSEDLCHVCVRATGAAEERARIVAMMRVEAIHYDADEGRCIEDRIHSGNAIDDVADRIERGEA
jgi:hypothetical protein